MKTNTVIYKGANNLHFSYIVKTEIGLQDIVVMAFIMNKQNKEPSIGGFYVQSAQPDKEAVAKALAKFIIKLNKTFVGKSAVDWMVQSYRDIDVNDFFDYLKIKQSLKLDQKM